MGRTKDKHVRQERDKGQGWDRSVYSGDPNVLSVEQLKEELKKRGLSTEGKTRQLRNRFVRALCIGLRPLKRTKRVEDPDISGKTVWFCLPEADSALFFDMEASGRSFSYHDADRPCWTTLRAAHPVPPDVTLSWSFAFEKLYNAVVGVCREDVIPEQMLGSDDRGWGYFTTLASKHHGDSSGEGEPYGQPCSNGDIVTVTMNTSRGLLSFSRNGKPVGEAYCDIYGTVYPAISVSGLNVIHVGKEKCLTAAEETAVKQADTGTSAAASTSSSVSLSSSSSSSSSSSPNQIHTITIIPSPMELVAGESKSIVSFSLNTEVLNNGLTLTPLAFGLVFTPKSVEMVHGETVSPPLTVTAVPQASTGPTPINVMVKRSSPKNLNTLAKPMFVVEGAVVVVGKSVKVSNA